VAAPLGLAQLSFLPDPSLSIATTEVRPWRKRRLRGEVHDENAAALGGVAGHAGLFGSAREVARFGACVLGGGAPVLAADTVDEMTREQARDADLRRGLGFSLWSPDPAATSRPLGPRSFGHTGFTGTSLWIDPDRSLVVALLTNAVHRGRAFDDFLAARIALHQALASAIRVRREAWEAP
jgi:CubicO group peptidase (beta-lactamase class C family)